MRYLLMILLALVLVAPARAAGTGAVSNPAVTPLGYQNTSLPTSNTTVTLTATPTTYPTAVTPKSVMVCNDNAVGGSDIWANCNTALTTGATTPTNAVLGDVWVIKPQERITFDAMPAAIALRGATATSSVRVIPIY